MNPYFLQSLLSLLAGVTVIVLLTAKFRVHAFFALFLACIVTGIGIGLPMPELLATIKNGFGNIMGSLGFIIVLGTTLGIILEFTGSTRVMAIAILRLVGERNAAWAISLTGFIVGLPVFCDSGYMMLYGLNKSLARSAHHSLPAMSICLATGLYSVHCLIPPHPGAAAAAGTIGADIGELMLYGIIIAIPAMIVGHAWAVYAARRWKSDPEETSDESDNAASPVDAPGVFKAFLPVIAPILLIASRSFITGIDNGRLNGLAIVGDPIVALSIGVILALLTKKRWTNKAVSSLLQHAVEKAGSVLVIIGAGGAFGAVLTAAKLGEHFSNAFSISQWGILFPFLLTVILKTAQGSSTVAIITAASIVLPLLPALHLDTNAGKIVTVLAMGAGSMMISHANDAYFWVIAKFSGLTIKTMFRVYTVATVLMGLTSLLFVYFLSLILL